MQRLRGVATFGCLAVALGGISSGPAAAQQTRLPQPPTRCVTVELYERADHPPSADAHSTLQRFIENRPGTVLRVYDLDGPEAEKSRKRLHAVAKHFRIEPDKLPIIYSSNRVIGPSVTGERLIDALNETLRIDAFVRDACPHCAAAKPFLAKLQQRYPGFQVRIRDVVAEPAVRTEVQQLVQRHGQAAASLPVIHLCNQLIVGFDHENTTGRRIEQILAPWTHVCRQWPPRKQSRTKHTPVPVASRRSKHAFHWAGLVPLSVSLSNTNYGESDESRDDGPSADNGSTSPSGDSAQPLPDPDELPLPGELPLPADLPLPGDGDLSGSALPPQSASSLPKSVKLPLFGRLDAGRVGLPLFTLAVGLVDGFNPCAMWVLLFLLSILVSLKNRVRILAVASTFVIVSGLAYFAFMAAWLNIFQLIGLLRPVQVALALLAIAIGAIHIKDFFAFKQGISLSIPESAKPGIYARVRRIVNAENLIGAIVGAAVLAVMVNVVELLCTAGLPALYVEVLTLQQFPAWKNYAYLGLYILAYMFDDGLMVAVVVVTLGRRKMQEHHGRVLKLISGCAILVLGVIMLIKPEWLV